MNRASWAALAAASFSCARAAAGSTRRQGERPAALAVPRRSAEAAVGRAVVRVARPGRARCSGSQSERGHWFVVAFLYTHCPDVCPLIANNLGTAMRKLPDLRVLAVSVDPKGDTPAAVRKFLRVHRLPAKFRYLTGTRARARAGLEEVPRRGAPGPERNDHPQHVRAAGRSEREGAALLRLDAARRRARARPAAAEVAGVQAADGGRRGGRLDSTVLASWNCCGVGGLCVSGRAPSGRRPPSTISA